MSKSKWAIVYIGAGYVFVSIINLFRIYFDNFDFAIIPKIIFAATLSALIFTISDTVETLFSYFRHFKALRSFSNESFSNYMDLTKGWDGISRINSNIFIKQFNLIMYAIAIASPAFLILVRTIPTQRVLDSIVIFTFGLVILNVGYREITLQLINELSSKYSTRYKEIDDANPNKYT